jgi:hypothetical protein
VVFELHRIQEVPRVREHAAVAARATEVQGAATNATGRQKDDEILG